MIEREITFSRENLDKLSVSELNTILRNELETDTPDREKVLLVLSILETRDAKEFHERIHGASEEWESTMGMYRSSLNIPVAKPNRSKRGWIKSLAIAAVITLVLLMTVPQALGAESIFKIIGQWTQELFKFSNTNNWDSIDQNEYVFRTEHEGLQQIYDAVVAQGITDPVVPTWIPDGYILNEMKIHDQPWGVKISAFLSNKTGYIQITFLCYNSFESSKIYPKDDEAVQTIEYNGVLHYLVSNDNSTEALWNIGTLECSITTNCATDELTKILNSIYIGG